MTSSAIPPGFHPIRHDRLLQERIHDAYQARAKPPEPTICPQCHAVFHNGRWDWRKLPEQAHSALCPACRRINDNYPAGFVTLEGDFFETHRGEIMRLVLHEEQRAQSEHPLQRIMGVDNRNHGVVIHTTDIHLARALGEAVRRAYQGELDFHYNPEEALLRVHWRH